MANPVCLLPPDRAGYAVDYGKNVLVVALEGGASSFRQDILGAANIIQVQWICNRKAFDYLMAFYRTAVSKGSLPFDIDLIIDTAEPLTYTVHFLTPPKLNQQSGETHWVTATLEAIDDPPLSIDDGDVITAGPF